MQEQVKLKALTRGTGKGPSRKLRREGRIPAVLYGGDMEGAIPIAVNGNEIDKVLHTGAGSNVIVYLDIEGESEPRTVMFKEVVEDPIKDVIEHIDFYQIVMGTKVTVNVPIHIVGKAAGAEEGGILQHDTREIEVECLPSQIPDYFEIDVSHLNIGDSFHVSDLKLEEGIEVLDDQDTTLASCVPPTMEAEPTTAEEAEEALAESFEEAPEGGEGEGEGEKEE